MSNDAAQAELLVVLAVMLFLLIFAVTASALFIRQWRREQNETKRRTSLEGPQSGG
jgi:type II secretory pathway pseudopilin PulG